MALLKRFVLVFLLIQSFIEEKIYENKLDNRFTSNRDILNRIGIYDMKDTQNIEETLKEQGSKLISLHNNLVSKIKSNRETLMLYYLNDKLTTIGFVKLALDQQISAKWLCAIDGITAQIVIFLNKENNLKRLYYEDGIIKQIKAKVREVFTLNNEVIVTRDHYINNINTNMFSKFRHVNMRGYLEYPSMELLQFVDVFANRGQKFTLMNINNIILNSKALAERMNSIDDSILSTTELLQQSSSGDMDKIEINYLNATLTLVQNSLKITKTFSEINFQIENSQEITETFSKINSKINFQIDTLELVTYAIFAFCSFYLIKVSRIYMRHGANIEKEIMNKGRKKEKMNKKKRKENNNKIEQQNIEECSTVMEWLDLVPNFQEVLINMLSMKKYSNKIEEFQYENSCEDDQVRDTSPKRSKSVPQKNVFENEKKTIVPYEKEKATNVTQLDDSSCSSKADGVGVDFTNLCWNCSQTQVKLFKCGGCRKARYCSRSCIVEDWSQHGSYCLKVQDKRSKKKLNLT